MIELVSYLVIEAFEQENVKADLYNMLLYGPGEHFQKHRDTETKPGNYNGILLYFFAM